MLMAQELLFLVDFVIDEQLLKNLNLQIQSTPIKRHISTSIGLTLTVMFAWIPILIIFVSILRLSYVGPHRLAWWKVRIGDGLRIPDTRRIPRDTFPPSHTVVHPIQRLIFMQGWIFFQIPGEYLGIHSHQATPSCTSYNAWCSCRGEYFFRSWKIPRDTFPPRHIGCIFSR